MHNSVEYKEKIFRDFIRNYPDDYIPLNVISEKTGLSYLLIKKLAEKFNYNTKYVPCNVVVKRNMLSIDRSDKNDCSE